MTESVQDIASAQTIALITRYGFDLGGHTAEELVTQWQNHYEANWLRLAVIEALYQGRYKAYSVEQILVLWRRRGQSLYHFNHEFERLVCSNFPQDLTQGMADAAIAKQDEGIMFPDFMTQNAGMSAATESQPAANLPEIQILSTGTALDLVAVEAVAAVAEELRRGEEASDISANLGEGVRHTDFHTKLKAIAKKEEPELSKNE